MGSQLSPLERVLYKDLDAKYGTKGYVVSPHVLRSEVTINNQDSTLTFPILEDTLQPLKTEIRLNKNDVMYVTGVALFIYPKINNQEGKAPLETYPNQTAFVAAAGFVPTDLETIYNGKLRLQVGSKEYIPGLDMSKFRYVPQTQQSAATNRSMQDEDSAYIDLAAHYTLSGSAQINLQALIPMWNGVQMQAVAANTQNQLVLKLRGFIIRGIAQLVPQV